METRVLLVARTTAERLLRNQELTRKLEVKHFAANLLGLKDPRDILVVRGPEELVKGFEVDGEEVTGKEKEDVLKKLKEMEESSAAGVGLIFG